MIGTQTFEPGRGTVRPLSQTSLASEPMDEVISNTLSLFRTTGEQEPNYQQTFTSLSRWSQKAESQTASQCSMLTMKALLVVLSQCRAELQPVSQTKITQSGNRL